MKKINSKYLSLLVFITFLCISACKKDENIADLLDETNTNNSVIPSFSYKANDADAVFAAVNGVTYQNIPLVGLQKVDLNTAIAVFFSSAGHKPYVDGGTVSCEGKALTKDTSKVYTYTPSGTDVITISGNIDWNIAGNAATGMPLVNHTSTSPLPGYNGIANGSLTSTVNRSSDITITINGTVTNADSVFVTISSGSNYVQKVVATTVNCTFTAAQLSALAATDGAANGIIQVAPFKVETTTVSGKKYYFVDEASYTKFVTIE